MDNKNVFANNLKRQMELHGKTRREICATLGFSYYTFSDWVNAKKYPRMDKVEMLANYFGIQKSDLIEEKLTPETKKDNERLAKLIVRMRTDKTFFSLVDTLYDFDDAQITSVSEMVKALQTFKQ